MTTDERIEKVEGQLARLRWFNRCVIVCIILSLGAWFMLRAFGPDTAWAQSGVKEFRAKKFVLEDKSGNMRAALTVEEFGSLLSLHDENGNMRAALTVTREGPALVLREKGKTRAELGMLNGKPQLVLLDENGNPRATAGVGNDGPILMLVDENRKPIWQAP